MSRDRARARTDRSLTVAAPFPPRVFCAGRPLRALLQSVTVGDLPVVHSVLITTSPMALDADQPPTVEGFLKTVIKSGLFTSEQLHGAVKAVPPDQLKDAQTLADHLVKTGKLTRFQANKLLQGITKGLVLGTYHLLSPIGKGGMGAVFLARDSRTQTLVAVKVLPPKKARAEERMLVRFRREMEICQKVDHPNLTRTFESGVHEDVNYIAMEFIPGRNLFRLVQDEGPLEVPRAARLFREIALGLDYAHGQGLIHRDLKPSNIVITPDDHPRVLDLGLALMQGEECYDKTVVGGQGYVVGTMDYLAPEQAEDAFNVDARADIYALGCTLYYALTKQPPFPGGNALQKLLRHRLDDPTPVVELNPNVPPEFVALVNRMMAKEKEKRVARAIEVYEALAPWAGDVSPAPTRSGPVPVRIEAATEPAPAPPASPPVVVPWFVEQAKVPAAPATMPITKPKAERRPSVGDAPTPKPSPVAVTMPELAPSALPTATAVPLEKPAAACPAGLPFWMDYLVPVGAGGLFLFVAWLIGFLLLLQRQ